MMRTNQVIAPAVSAQQSTGGGGASFIPHASLGPLTFTSGYAPKSIDGPKRDMHVLEHEIPGREGGIVEYLGSKQPTYRLQGFFAPLNDQFNGPAASNLSGTSYLPLTPDAAAAYLFGLRGSGVLLLQLESTYSNFSGYTVWYDQDFYYIKSLNIAMEAGRGYPYYPYTIDLLRASTLTYGNSSGAVVFSGIAGNYMSGYMMLWLTTNPNYVRGETIKTLGVYVNSVASGNLKVGLYTSGTGSLVAQSAAQPACSGWNYFPLQPAFTTVSGNIYTFALASDATNQSGLTILCGNPGGTWFSYQSGYSFTSGFPATAAPGTFNGVSGFQLDMVMVAP